jgi:ribonuclease HII
MSLLPYYSSANDYEIGVDEAGRGPLFGRVYVAAVVLPKEGFRYDLMRDSKKIKSKKKMRELAEYIKENAVAWSVRYAEADDIDRNGILNCVIREMHNCIIDLTSSSGSRTEGPKSAQLGIGGNAVASEYGVSLSESARREQSSLSGFEGGLALIDGNYFKLLSKWNPITEELDVMPHQTVEKGDGTYASIAAASILAKYERDTYIEELCIKMPELVTKYKLDTNMGYGTKAHMDGIKEHGVTQWHRVTFKGANV